MKEIIRRNSILIYQIEYAICYFRRQNFDIALRMLNEILYSLSELIPKYDTITKKLQQKELSFDVREIHSIIKEMFEIQQTSNYVLLADYYELYLLPYLYKMQNAIMVLLDYTPQMNKNYEAFFRLIDIEPKEKKLFENISQDKKISRDMCVEFTNSGAYTLKRKEKNKERYYHSNTNPLYESLQFVEYWHEENCAHYIIYGLGLGYWMNAFQLIDENLKIDIYEDNPFIIDLAFRYGIVEEWINNSNFKLHYDPKLTELFKALIEKDEDTNVLFHYPSLESLEDKTKKEWMEEYFIQYSSIKNQKPILIRNFRENLRHFDAVIDELKEEWNGKDLYIIAAGPSLDKNFKELKKVGENGIILATGTVFKKLMNVGIRPDYVIITEANKRVLSQIVGVEDSDIPLILLSTAYKEFANNYKGKKYFVFQNGFTYSEEYANKNGYLLCETGGSVSTVALDVGIRLGVKKVIFVGLDLSYPDNYVHAADTSRRDLINTEDMLQVNDIFGNLIYTSKSFNLYRKWIQQRIAVEKEIFFIDATEGGVLIKGTQTKKLGNVVR